MPTLNGWTLTWTPNKAGWPGPKQWARWDHASGYSIGEVDAGKYMAVKDGLPVVKPDGTPIEWSHPEAAMAFVNKLIEPRPRP